MERNDLLSAALCDADAFVPAAASSVPLLMFCVATLAHGIVLCCSDLTLLTRSRAKRETGFEIDTIAAHTRRCSSDTRIELASHSNLRMKVSVPSTVSSGDFLSAEARAGYASMTDFARLRG
jgi:RES domain-containing protein